MVLLPPKKFVAVFCMLLARSYFCAAGEGGGKPSWLSRSNCGLGQIVCVHVVLVESSNRRSMGGWWESSGDGVMEHVFGYELWRNHG